MSAATAAEGGEVSAANAVALTELPTTLHSEEPKPVAEQNCPICLEDLPSSDFVRLGCSDSFCRDCLAQYFSLEIKEGRVSLQCPNCKATISQADVREVVDAPTYDRYLQVSVDVWLAQHPYVRRCPGADCSNAVIIHDDNKSSENNHVDALLARFGKSKHSKCKGDAHWKCSVSTCEASMCLKCGQTWHPGLRCEEKAVLKFEEGAPAGQAAMVRPCPGCKAPIFKEQDGACNHMKCAVCSVHFCWLCMNVVTELHFLTPSGCTYFGNRSWTPTKRLVMSSALALAAPALVGVAAAVAVPGIIIGMPVARGKKAAKKTVHTGFARGLTITSHVVGSLLVAPVVAAVVVGLGAPALVICAYTVAPHYLVKEYRSNKKKRAKERQMLVNPPPA